MVLPIGVEATVAGVAALPHATDGPSDSLPSFGRVPILTGFGRVLGTAVPVYPDSVEGGGQGHPAESAGAFEGHGTVAGVAAFPHIFYPFVVIGHFTLHSIS